MPTYSIRAPDGKTYTVTGPKGATEAQVRAEVLRQHPQAAKPAPRDNSKVSGFLAGAVKPIDNLAAWAAQSPIGKAVDDFGASLGFPRTADAVRQNDAWRKNNSRGGWQIAGNIAGTVPTFAIRNPVVQGLAGGALLTDDRSLKGTAKSAAIGAIGGKMGDVAGKRVIAPTLERVGRTAPVRAVAEATTRTLNKALGSQVKLPPVAPQFTAAERNLPAIPEEVRRNIEDAARLKLPFSLADASPDLRSLAGSVSRFSPQARNLAEEVYAPRAAQINQRAVNAMDEYLAPVTDIAARSQQIRDNARAWSQPYYKKALSQPAPDDEILAEILRRPASREALNRARTIMANEGKNADEIEWLMRAGESPTVPDAGRFAPVRVGNEFDQVGTTRVRGWGGASIPKRGPTDLVGWIRLNGGLSDSGGELAHMGLTNAPRSGMDFVGREAQFGPLVNNTDGMNFDDAALKAWEAGYFPGLTDRPSTNEFLNALRGTQEGWNRHFLPDDLGQIDDFGAAQAEKFAAQETRGMTGSLPLIDTATDAGPRDFAPLPAPDMEAYKTPTFETLNYVKRGLDSVLNDSRSPLTGKLDLEGDDIGKSTNEVLQRFKGRLDELNPDYAKARSVYQEEIAPRSALQLGFNVLPKSNIPTRDVNRALEGIAPENLPEAARGYVTARADEVSRMAQGNPYKAVYGSLDEQSKIRSLFPEEGVENFDRIAGLESMMGKTYTELLGGSATQPRAMADARFAGMAPDVIGAGVDLATGTPTATAMNVARRGLADNLADRWALGFGAKKKADNLAPLLFDTDATALAQSIADLTRRRAEMDARQQVYQKLGGLFGLPAAAGLVSSR